MPFFLLVFVPTAAFPLPVYFFSGDFSNRKIVLGPPAEKHHVIGTDDSRSAVSYSNCSSNSSVENSAVFIVITKQTIL